MLITEIKLENFRSYEFLELPLESGINLIYGSNGSGKSTIIESIYYALSGKSFRTTETNSLIRDKHKQLQALIVFDDGKTVKVTKKINNTAVITQNKGQKKENYTSLVKRFPFELSGGENQRAAVVRSLIRNPDLLLLDEPFSNLDTVNKKYVKEIVFDIINESNLTTIIVNHDIEESLEISDKIIGMNLITPQTSAEGKKVHQVLE